MTNNPLKNPDPLGPKCIRPECDMKARTRGLCDACYRTAVAGMKKHGITWEKLIQKGKALEPQRKPSEAAKWLFDFIKPRGRKPKLRKVR